MSGIDSNLDEDAKALHEMGYSQELARHMGLFQSFTISFSIVCILAGGITAFPLALSAGGGAALGYGWPLACFFGLLVAASLGQIASSYPTAGGIYHWASILGNKGYGWAAAWFNLLGLIFCCASINLGVYLLFKDLFMAGVLGVDVSGWGWGIQTSFVLAVTVIQCIINHYGIRLTMHLTDFSGYMIFVISLVLTGALIYYAPTIDFSRLYKLENFTGEAGGSVWPTASNSLVVVFLLGLLQGVYTFTGFDASGHTAEETRNAAREVPKGMMHAVLWSGVFGYIMVCSFVLAMPSVSEGAAQGFNAFPWLMNQSPMPGFLKDSLIFFIVLANFLCGLAGLTSCSRMLFAFVRDGGVPKISGFLRKVSKSHRTPANAIWTSAALAFVATLYGDAFAVLSTGCAVLLYVSYVMPITAGLFAEGKTWTKKGPFHLGAASKLVALCALIGCLILIWVGIQEPNEKVGYLLVGIVITLVGVWFGHERKRFEGPPLTPDQVAAKQQKITEEEKALEN